MVVVEIGKIVKAQGIKGEVKVAPMTDDVARFNTLKSVYIDGKKLEIEAIRLDGGVVFIKFKQFGTRNDAEASVGKMLTVERGDAVKLPKDRYFISDIVGCKVVCDGKKLGVLSEVLQNGAADVYVLDGGKIMFPALKKLLLNVNTSGKTIEVDAKTFSEVAVYKDEV